MRTSDDIRKALELLPFEGYARRQLCSPDRAKIAEMIDGEFQDEFLHSAHGTGRTTRILCSLLAAAATGNRVSINAKPLSVENAIRERAQAYAERLGINPKLIVGRLGQADLEFFDHTWFGA